MTTTGDEWDRFLELLNAEARALEYIVRTEIAMRWGATFLYAARHLRDARKAADYIAQLAERMRQIINDELLNGEGIGAEIQHAAPLARRILTGPVPEGSAWASFSQTHGREQTQRVFDRGRGLAIQMLRGVPAGSKFSMADMHVALALMLALLARSTSAGREKETIGLVAELARSLLEEGQWPEDTQGGAATMGTPPVNRSAAGNRTDGGSNLCEAPGMKARELDRTLKKFNRRGFIIARSEEGAKAVRQALVEACKTKVDILAGGNPHIWIVAKAEVVDDWIELGFLQRKDGKPIERL